VYVLEELWSDKVNLHEKGFPDKQYVRAIQRLADCGEKLLGLYLNDIVKSVSSFKNIAIPVTALAGEKELMRFVQCCKEETSPGLLNEGSCKMNFYSDVKQHRGLQSSTPVLF